MANGNRENQNRDGDEAASTDAFDSGNGCCFHLPCFGSQSKKVRIGGSSSTKTSFLERIRIAENENKWWARPLRAFKKLREWSEIVAGPKWKTFIRRLNRNRSGERHVKFQYDPLSYSLNFDEGPPQNRDLDEDYPDFTSRYVCKSSVATAKAPTSV
ncbi:hypothetical protein Nepgr_023316 [Nepenthes gracilis]|uniref:Uncharacterized protein n=1 Tax=Nepenthes gracilis TaxID=150966 RepID=A0AAD3T2L3_NEPGR|nr:hypothetical protein Nepgr_023316 [Nepenthes gracilis]